MKKNLIQRIKDAWRAFTGESTPGVQAAGMRVDGLLEAIEAMQKNGEVIDALQRVFVESETEHRKIMNEFFHAAVKRVMPEYLFDLYKDTKQKIPGLNMHIANFFDIQDRAAGREITMHYRGVLIGKMTVKSKQSATGIVTTHTIDFLYEPEQAKTEA